MGEQKTDKKALCLISSGIDSPVAAWMMKEKGLDIIGVHFDNRPFTDYRPLEKTKKICKKLGIKKLYVVKHGLTQKEIAGKTNRRFNCVLCRRMMFRTSERIAKMEGCRFLITGENLGQVASQTLDNLVVCNGALDMIVLRPLLCFDKQETIDLAKKIGTFDTSIEPSYCCKLVPKFPATKSDFKSIEYEEKKMDVESFVEERLKDMEILDL